MPIILPTLIRVPTTSIASYAFSGGTLTINLVGGGSVTYSDTPNNMYNQNAMLNAIDAAVASGTVRSRIPAGPLVIDSISPSNFPLTGGTLVINGAGFSSSDVGKLWIEDSTGGPDSNSTSYNVTVVSSTEMTATWNSAGDGATTGATPQNLIIYYKSNSGVQSNIIPAYIDSTGAFVTLLPTS